MIILGQVFEHYIETGHEKYQSHQPYVGKDGKTFDVTVTSSN